MIDRKAPMLYEERIVENAIRRYVKMFIIVFKNVYQEQRIFGNNSN